MRSGRALRHAAMTGVTRNSTGLPPVNFLSGREAHGNCGTAGSGTHVTCGPDRGLWQPWTCTAQMSLQDKIYWEEHK